MTAGLPALPQDSTPRRGVRRGWIAAALLAMVAIGASVAWWQSQPDTVAAEGGLPEPKAAALDDSSARAPSGARVRVRVVNISGVSGLARRATQHLRDYGFDVVDFTSGRTEEAAGTRIVVHGGRDDEWAERVRKALGVGTVGTDADTSRFVDLTVFVGHDWRPSTETLRP